MSNKQCIKVRLQYLERGYKANRSTSRANCFALLLSGFPNLRSGPILAVLIIFSYVLPLKLGLIQTLSRLCSLRPDFGRNADWLLEQCHRIWLAVKINGSWKRFFLAWLIALKNILLSVFIVLRSCGRKICLNMCHGNSQNSNSCP